MTALCELALRYGTDKCPELAHPYTPVYDAMFGARRAEIRKVVEFGIGYYEGIEAKESIFERTLGRTYHRGASLKMWRDYFPNATIYGADIRPECMFRDERIRTFVCDETDPRQVAEVIDQTGPDIDLWVDDARHRTRHQANLCRMAMPRLDPGVTYVIEDVRESRALMAALPEYDCEAPPLPPRRWRLVVVRHREAAR